MGTGSVVGGGAGGVGAWREAGEVEQVEAVLAGVCGWVGAVWLRFDGAALPSCWLWHPGVVKELWWCCHAWQTSYSREGVDWRWVADWHEWMRPGVAVREIRLESRDEVAVGEPVQVSAIVQLGTLTPDDVAVELYHGPTAGAHEIAKGTIVRMRSLERVADGQWHYNTFSTADRYTGMFLLPTGTNQLAMAGTRDVLWSELGYTQPAGAFNYVFNDARLWQFGSLTQPPSASIDVHQELPTADYPNVHTSIDDAYVDTTGRTHILYSVVGASSGGQFIGRHAILQNGTLVKDVPTGIYYPNLSRLIQDTTGRFHLISACGTAVYVQSGLAGDTDGTQLGAVQTLNLTGSYVCNALNNYITAPRGGTPLADFVDGVFDSGGQWVYYRIQLASPTSVPTPTSTPKPSPTPRGKRRAAS